MDKETDFYDYSRLISDINARWCKNTVLILGNPFTGKTRLWKRLSATQDGVFSMSFKGYDVSRLPGLINSEFTTWDDLFDWICSQGTYKYLIVDDADCGKNTECFWKTLLNLNKGSMKLKVVLLATKNTTPTELSCTIFELSLMNWKALSDHLDLTGKELKELLCITGGYPEIMTEFNLHGSFEEKLACLLTPESAFWNLAPKILERHFSTVETYNTILYAMTQGNKALTTIAKASGMKNNACLEYLKKLLEKGLIRQKESQNGHKEYFIVNSYIYLWYAFVYTAKLKAGFAISDQTIIDFDEKLRKEVYRRFFRTASLDYLQHFYFKNWSFDIINDELHQDVTIDKVNFDYVGEDKYLHRMVLFKCGLIKTPLLKKALRAMKQIPLSDKEYVFLFTNKAIPRGCWTIAKKSDNIHIVQEKSLYRLRGLPNE